ncbi:MAG: hypothetical protein AB7T06_16205 [Kofleriaceae bacterium]
MTSRTAEVCDHEQPAARGPSSRVWASAMAGLLGLQSAACGDDKPNVEPDPDAPIVDAAVADAPPDAETPSKIISETPGEHTYAELKAMCDARGGYTEIYMGCSGTNTCAGFSYGDWGADSVLVEHTCAAVSGCNGMGCVVLPSDSAPGHGRSAADILGAALPDTEGVAQRSCNYCHAEWSKDGTTYDITKFKVRVPEGSTRDLSNWLDRSPEAMARIIAFGAHATTEEGQQIAYMAPYYQMFSRAEIERVVAYIRDPAMVTPSLAVTRIADPSTFAPRITGKRPHGARARLLHE